MNKSIWFLGTLLSTCLAMAGVKITKNGYIYDHDKDLNEVRNGSHWYAIIPSGESTEIKKVVVKVSAPVKRIDGAREAQITSSPESLYLLSKLKLKEGKIDSYFPTKPLLLGPYEAQEVKVGAKNLKFIAQVKYGEAEFRKKPHVSVDSGYFITMEYNGHKVQLERSQKLAFTYAVVWAADLNEDGMPEVVIFPPGLEHRGIGLTLFMSEKAKDGYRMIEVGTTPLQNPV